MRLTAYVRSVGVLGPGIPDWPGAHAILTGAAPHACSPTLLPVPALLPAAERRRSGRLVRLVLAVASEATLAAGLEPAELPSVFASSGGDGRNCHELCETLASPAREVSPTRFSNSVHNAPAGYWSIATRAERGSTALAAYDASFGAGLLEALAQVAVEGTPVLLVAYDADYPPPLAAKRPVPDAFGVALTLLPERDAGAIARIEIEPTTEAAAPMRAASLEGLRVAIPAARCLPLLEALASGARGTVLEYLPDRNLRIRSEPC